VSPYLNSLNSNNNDINLTELENKILSTIKKITIIEFKNDNKNQGESQPIISIIDTDCETEKVKSRSKRAISPKYKSAAISFFGSILSQNPNGFQNNSNRRNTLGHFRRG